MNIRKYLFGGFSKYYDLDNKNTRKAVNEGTKKFANAGLNVLGMVGDLFSSLFTGTPTTTTNPKTVSPEMALHLKQSILKGMTWLSPLNYGTAIATGHGLNANKGEELVAKWDPRLLLIGRLGELYVGPKAIRGVSKGVKKGIVANEFRRTVNKGIRTSPQKTSWSSYQDFRLNGFNGLQLIERSWLDKELETGDPNTMVHYDFGDHKSSFRKNNGAYVKDNKLIPGQSSKEQTNYIWWSNEGPWQHSLWMFVNPELKTPTRYISIPKTKLFLRVNEHPEKVIGLNQVAPETIMDNEFVTEGPVDLSNASIILKDPLGWWSRVKYTKGASKQNRVISEGTYPWYRGKQHSVNEVVNPDGTINPRQAMKILHEVSEQFPGSYKMEHRLENPKWHKDDPNTYEHTKRVAQSAWRLPTPEGFTKQDQMIAALGHDFGKMISGDGHAQIGADLARQVFPDLTDAQYNAIAEHMGTPVTSLGLVTKAADITNGRPFGYLQQYAPDLYSQYFGNTTHKVNKVRNNVIYTDDYGLLEMPFELYFENKVNSIPKDLVDKSPISSSELEYKQEAYNTMDFTPKYRMSVGKLNEAWGYEILRRLRNLGYNTDQNGLYIRGQHQVITNPELYVRLNNKSKVTLGYFNHEGGENGGFYGGYWNEAAIDPTNVKSIPSAALHERVMHGTDKMLEGILYNQGGNAQHIYLDFINRIFYDNEGNLKPVFREDSKGNIAFNGYRIYKDDLNWKEVRATIAELARKLYVKVKGDNKITSVQDLEKFRPAFEKEVDTNPNLLESLSKINGYGLTYSKVGPVTNPTFLEELKWLLKYAPVAGTPLIFRYNEKE